MKFLRSILLSILSLMAAVAIAQNGPSGGGNGPGAAPEATAAEVTAGTLGTKYVSPRRLATSSKYPIGTILPAAPSDGGTWLQMNGQIVSQSTYATLFALIGHQPEFTWTASTAAIVSFNNFIHVCFGNSNTYVGVGKGGTIRTSTDRITWTSQTSGVATDLNAVCWDATNSLFIAVGASNVILTSPDGVTWSSRTSGVTSTLANVVTVAGRTVAVGSSGWISYSTNGTAWTATQPNSGPSHAWLVYAPPTWFTCPSGTFTNGIVYSTDGTTWNYVAKPTTNGAEFAGFDATNFYLLDSTNNEIKYSPTGAAWSAGTSVNALGDQATNNLTPVIFPNGTIALIRGTGSVYTANGFSTTASLRMTETANLTNNSPLSTPLGTMSGAKFAVAQTSGALIFSCDGVNWFIPRNAAPNSFLTGTPLKIFFANGYHFLTVGNTLQFLSAPEPYAPATQFQIPTRAAPSGTALYIKAL